MYLRAIPLDADSSEQRLLNIEDKRRSNLFRWSGQFSPQLVEFFLARYARVGNIVLDPFAGSGTVLCECGRKGLEAVAAEINPAAYSIARLYQFMNCKQEDRRGLIAEVEDSIARALPHSCPLFEAGTADAELSAQRALLKARESLDEPQSLDLIEALIVLSDFYRPGLDRNKVMSVWSKIASVLSELPYSGAALNAMNADARKLPLASESVDLVVTSPPYINVFNYHQQYRASAEALGWNLLNVAKSEIGSNRKHRANRFFTVIQYCLDIAGVLMELTRVCKSSGRIIFVVGRESRVRGTPLLNGDIVALVATKCLGLRMRARQERVFKNKFGTRIFEDVLHFTGIANMTRTATDPKLIGKLILEGALKTAPALAVADIKDALGRVHEVFPSPIYDPGAARTLEEINCAPSPR
ncbi:MAG TPA: DNA methyltransferase [Terriglobia bacterium]|nr:DNA methyltransferase [Terriglobia bacterium]